MQCLTLTEAIRRYIESKNGSVTDHDLFDIEWDLGSPLRQMLKEPIEYFAKWMAEDLSDNLIVQNGYETVTN